MLQYVDFETAYEFLHAVTGQVHAADARAHFHIDPDAHDRQHVEAITSLFDARVALGDEVRVRTRDVIE
jgi:ABC-type nickel/cobalt efflux system permease component RcnA